jgi:aldehyde:ferredoxin oxidoreductase
LAQGDRIVYGWVGKILRVDLTDREVSEVPTSKYIPRLGGGWGIAAKIAWDELNPEVSAFDPENRLMVMTGPLTGTLIPGTGRAEICTVSPSTYSFKGPTEDYVRSGIGGQWAPELKYAGYDGVIIQGRAEHPVWIYIHDRNVEIKDAGEFWGLDTYSVQEAIWRELGSKKVKVMCIGPAGEKLIRFATIATDNGNHAGVGGTGAVMGSKNLKAIAVRGTGKIEVAKPEEVYKLAYKMHRYRFRPEARPPYGMYGVGVHRLGAGGEVQNRELVEHWKRDTIKAIACWGCPVACRMVFSVPNGIKSGISNFCSGMSRFRRASRDFYGRYTKNYMRVAGLVDGNGINCHDVDYIVKWLRGCYKTGLLRGEETGISLKDYGSYESYERLIHKVVNREGFGDLLAEGVQRASDSLGKLGKEFINDVNRGFDEIYHPRILPTSAFLAAFESSQRLTLYHTWATKFMAKHSEEPLGRGWLSNEEWVSRIKEVFGTENVIDHSDEGYYQPEKAYLAKWTEDYKTAGSGCFILCDWVMGHFWSWYSDEPHRRDPSAEHESKAFSLVTGVEMEVMDMLKLGERVRNLERAIMVREGRRREDDTVADYCFTEPQGKPKEVEIPSQVQPGRVPGPDGHWINVHRAIDREKWEKLKDTYYTLRGWDPITGIPTRGKLEELDLKDIADDLNHLGLLPM